MLKKNLFYTFLAIAFVLVVNCAPKETPTSSISGTIENLEKNYVILSKVIDIQQKTTTVLDTILIDKSGKFQINNLETPNIYNLTFNHKKTIQLAIDNNQTVEIKGTNLDSLIISGSKDTALLLAYENFRKESLNRLVYSVRKEISNHKKEKASEEKIATLRSLEIENYNKHLVELTVFIEEKMGTSIAIYPTSIRWNGENLAAYTTIVSNFKATHPTSEITSKLEKRIALLQKTTVGSIVSNIKMPTKEGTLIELNNIKGTYTLIDFWASWCPPCRSESKILSELYNTYKSKGFEIYGISLDAKKQRWLDALEKDNRVWPNVSTVEGFNTPVAIEYGITALPTNFIIDAEGKIVASNMHGEHLKKFVEVLF
ncbi:Thiol-disulfide isomerase or thioredoxin [Lutibacter agarilyticus]|uniref:Thiol-disulfide isomerase or thioredoxin n=1 Tax=Lutibacter agarilyticus TaxID=1109740 RepID=A0A238VY50_9FLAO|nr:TlpA disulfide reductase family protein [Lutibacter agarilyticus]SNR38783.1 Thiol-disulfide isomerase or thioredoxin [Lutibacter agarilyticus]